mmetsp:Transcript_4482/g.6695  ORF Transcript_4482/g.6695 Transcript_4482/m.6695 type:complete len:119 (-) Transcript_4482:552-908(-)
MTMTSDRNKLNLTVYSPSEKAKKKKVKKVRLGHKKAPLRALQNVKPINFNSLFPPDLKVDRPLAKTKVKKRKKLKGKKLSLRPFIVPTHMKGFDNKFQFKSPSVQRPGRLFPSARGSK